MIKLLRGQKTGRKEQNRKKMDSTKRLHLFVIERASLQLLVKASLHLPLDFFKAVAAAAVYAKH
jgi:hypothetical protein